MILPKAKQKGYKAGLFFFFFGGPALPIPKVFGIRLGTMSSALLRFGLALLYFGVVGGDTHQHSVGLPPKLRARYHHWPLLRPER